MGFPTSKMSFTRSVTNNKRHYCKFWNRRKTDGGGDGAIKIVRRNTSFDSILSRQSLLSNGPNEPTIISLSSSSMSSLPNEDHLKIEEVNKVGFEKEEPDNQISYSFGDEDEVESHEEFMKISRSPSFKVYVTQSDIIDDKQRSKSNSKEDNSGIGEFKNEQPTTSIDTDQVESTNNSPNKPNIWCRLRGILPKHIGMKTMFGAAVGCYNSNNSNGSFSDSDADKKKHADGTVDRRKD